MGNRDNVSPTDRMPRRDYSAEVSALRAARRSVYRVGWVTTFLMCVIFMPIMVLIGAKDYIWLLAMVSVPSGVATSYLVMLKFPALRPRLRITKQRGSALVKVLGLALALLATALVSRALDAWAVALSVPLVYLFQYLIADELVRRNHPDAD